jgi:putative nucleotidyltransferase with HDIG domain
MINKIKKNSRKVFDTIAQLGQELNMPVYVVGGYVRDLLLGIDGFDIDFVVIGDAIRFCEEFKKRQSNAGSLVTYPRFGTSMIQYQNYKLEFVTARSEIYEENSRKPTVKKADLLSDLSRRDFTINTLALDIHPKRFGKITDPYNGEEDLKKGIIRTPLEPEQTFSDDPLRMMRAIRFSTRFNFKIEPNTFAAITNTAERLKIISQERITAEFNKIVLSKKPSLGINLLEKSGLLAFFFPEFVAMKGIEQREAHHHKDVYFHTLQVLDNVAQISEKLNLRLAAIFHDIAKPNTKRFNKKTGWTFHGHEVVGERMSASILHRLKYSNEIIDYVCKIVRLHLRPMALVSEKVTDSAIRRLLFLSGDEFEDLMTLCRADITSKNPIKVKRYLNNYAIVLKKAKEVEEKDQLRAFKSPVNGNEIMTLFQLSPGPQVGRIKKIIEEAILSGEIPNEHDAAYAYISNLPKEQFADPESR